MREVFRDGQVSGLARQTEGELPNELMYGLLGSLGNGEQKCLDVIVMWVNPKKVHSRPDLYREIMSRQEPNRRWEIDRGVPFAHCEKSLAPIGLVAKEALFPRGRMGIYNYPIWNTNWYSFCGRAS